jgi:hypothetical protein
MSLVNFPKTMPNKVSELNLETICDNIQNPQIVHREWT